MNHSSPSLPLDLIQECLRHVSRTSDIAQCRLVCKDVKYRIDHDSELRLRLFARRHRIESPDLTKPGSPKYSFHDELWRLKAIEDQQSGILYGQQFPMTRTLQLVTTNADLTHLFAVANGYVFLPLRSPGMTGITGIARHRLDAFDDPPDILNLGRTIRHFQTDATEDVLFVVLLSEDM